MSAEMVRDPFLTPKQIGKIIGASDTAAGRLCRSGRLPAKNISSGSRNCRWRVKLSDLMRFMDSPDNVTELTPPKSDLPPGVRRLA